MIWRVLSYHQYQELTLKPQIHYKALLFLWVDLWICGSDIGKLSVVKVDSSSNDTFRFCYLENSILYSPYHYTSCTTKQPYLCILRQQKWNDFLRLASVKPYTIYEEKLLLLDSYWSRLSLRIYVRSATRKLRQKSLDCIRILRRKCGHRIR
jgi:hypothetical protein